MPEIANPYIAGSPVTGTEMFFGREDVFASIRQTLSGKHRDNVPVLYGQRRTGKTSVLYQMSRHVDARYLCIFIDLHGLALEGLAGFLWELANHITRMLRRDYQLTLPPLNRDEFMSDPRSSFEDQFLDSVWSTIGERHLLLMLDEAIRLQEQVQAGKLEKEIFEYLRHLMQHFERLNFLFSLGSGLEEMEHEYAFLFNVALYEKISFLSREAAVALITEPVKGQYEVPPHAVDRILQITSCHPYYTQLVCHSLFDRWQQHHPPALGAPDVDAVLDEVVERGLAVLKHVWDESTPGEKAVLAGMAAAKSENNRSVRNNDIDRVWAKLDVAIPKGEIALATQSLIAREIITGEDAYEFTVDLQRLWVHRYRRIEWVKEEIGAAVTAWGQSAAAQPTRSSQSQQALSLNPRRSPGVWVLALAGVLLVAILVGVGLWIGNRGAPGIVPSTGPGGNVIPGGEAASVNDLAAHSNTVWAATEGGLVRWTADGSTRVFHGSDLGFDDNCIQTIVAAQDGTLWLGCGGVAHIRPSGDQVQSLGFYNRDDGLGMGLVRALMLDPDGTVWAGGLRDANRPPPLSHFDGKQHPDGNNWRTDEPLMDALAHQTVQLNIQSLLRAHDGALWVGLAQDGILRWDGRVWTHFGQSEGVGRAGDADHRIRRLIQDSNGTIWAAASDQGLLRFDGGQGRWNKVAVISDIRPIRGIIQLADASLLASGDAMVARSIDGGRIWTLVGTSEGLGNDIGGMIQDSDGRVWAGAYTGGVSLLDGDRWRSMQR
jgi:hypothetical protein